MLVAHAVAAQQCMHTGAGADEHIAHDGVAQRLQGQEWRHGFQAHGLVRAGLHIVELRHLFERQFSAVAHHTAHFVGGELQRARVAPQQVDHPGQGVGGGVLAGQQHGQHIARHLCVVDAAAGLVGGHDHGFEQVARVRAQLGVGGQACARLRDEARYCGCHFNDAALQRTVGRQAHPAPGRQWREDALEQRRKDLVEVALEDVLVRLQGVDLGAEGQPGDGVDGVAHEVGLQRDGRTSPRGLRPAPGQARCHCLQRRKVTFDVTWVESRHDHAPLARPDLTVRAEDALCHAHFEPDLLQPRGPAKAIGAVAHDLRRQHVVAQHDDAPLAQRDLEEGPELAAPLLKLQVKARRAQLQRVAEEGPGPRAGQVFELTQRGHARVAAREGVDIHRCTPCLCWWCLC